MNFNIVIKDGLSREVLVKAGGEPSDDERC